MARSTIQLTAAEMRPSGAYHRNTKLSKELAGDTDQINVITLIKKDDGTGYWKLETGAPYTTANRPKASD